LFNGLGFFIVSSKPVCYNSSGLKTRKKMKNQGLGKHVANFAKYLDDKKPNMLDVLARVAAKKQEPEDGYAQIVDNPPEEGVFAFAAAMRAAKAAQKKAEAPVLKQS
jgi:hypothetical protein